MKNTDIQKLAERHGLMLSDKMKFNEMGIEFKVGFATDKDENQWLLRIPRRPDLGKQIAEVVQLYIRDVKSSLPRPLKELKGFEKIYLNPGEQKEVTITIDKSALSFFDPVKHDWVAEPGDFEALIGNSSDAIKTKIKFSLQ